MKLYLRRGNESQDKNAWDSFRLRQWSHREAEGSVSCIVYIDTDEKTYVYVHVHAYAYVYVFVFVYVCMYACMYVCMHACVYIFLSAMCTKLLHFLLGGTTFTAVVDMVAQGPGLALLSPLLSAFGFVVGSLEEHST